VRCLLIEQLLGTDTIKLEMAASSKDDAIAELVNLIVSAHPKLNRKVLVKSATDREKRMSTGLGKGVAVPRCLSKETKKTLCCVGVKKDGIDFEALDGLPVRIFFMVVAPEKSDESYVRILSRLYRLLNQETLRSGILKSRNPKEVLSLITEEERGFED
jgi:mannitol/fructose-specific phosphotransferase system IIA component (Ntr-type)